MQLKTLSDMSSQKTKYVMNRRPMHRQLVADCVSYDDLKLNIMMSGIKWHQLDWITYFTYLMSAAARGHENATSMHNSMLDVLESNDDSAHELARTLLDKTVLIETEKKTRQLYNKTATKCLMQLFAASFRLYPNTWNASWMWIKYRFLKQP